MELYEQILCETIAKEVIPSLRIDSSRLLELKCYQAILRIHEILEDEALEDAECFCRIEEIVCTLEGLGIASVRHDF